MLNIHHRVRLMAEAEYRARIKRNAYRRKISREALSYDRKAE